MSLILVGYRGSGKTTVGKRLAQHLRCELIDTDEMVVRMAGKTIRGIFAEQGEAAFRRLETKALQEALNKPDTVLSTGGGIVTVDENQQLLKSSGRPVIYLAAPAELLCERIHGDAATSQNRPALTSLGGGLDEVKSLVHVRDPLYCSVATHVVDASAPVEEIVSEILIVVGQQTRSDR